MDTVVTKILAERPSKHGEFAENSRATWDILRVLQKERNWPTMTDQQRHALYMIAHKMARIVCGDPNEAEHWDDTAGYATCVASRLRTPVVPFDGNDIYSSLAVGWNISREEAKKRVQEITYKKSQEDAKRLATPGSVAPSANLAKLSGGVQSPSSVRPGTPEDGGHHAVIDRMAEELRNEVNKTHG